jgi:leader peptidase (prepilin peptidase)/N-methyltransferase
MTKIYSANSFTLAEFVVIIDIIAYCIFLGEIMENVIVLVYIFVVGLCIGSFLNVCIYRIPKEESIANPPSHCGSCGTSLKAIDLVPVFSYLFLRGRCRYCKEKISIRYPLIELITALLLAAVYLQHQLSFDFLKYSVLVIMLILIGIIDFDTTDVYFKTTITGVIFGVAFLLYGYYLGNGVKQFILGAAVGGSAIAAVILLTKGMGWGDAEICLMSGLFLGLKLTLFMLFVSVVLGGFIGLLLILFKIKSRKDYIPFGPFIALGAIFTVFFGDKVIQWYLTTMLI